ncbi:MAG: ABC transporter permease, partial [Acidobacteriota bacterium]|nr:ABC transporter permease [Acidobacteriota bacterium]
MHELRHALRSLVRAPGFTAVSVLTLALAIGACTAIYSVVHGVLLQPLPYPEPGRLVQVWQTGAKGGQNQLSDPNFEDLRDGVRALGPLGQYAQGNSMILAADRPLRAAVSSVSREFFDVFRTQPRLGRLFDERELRQGG